MPDGDFTRALTAATRRYGRFGHAAHVYVVWSLLRERPALDALAEFRRGLRALAQDLGVPEKYHETRTVAWTLLVLDRLDRHETWEAFEARCPELFDAGAVDAAYSRGVLDSPRARSGFVVPDGGAGPQP